MSKAGQRLIRALRQVDDFLRGRRSPPMVMWVPDGDEGDMVRHWVDTPEEFYRLLYSSDAKPKEDHASRNIPRDIA